MAERLPTVEINGTFYSLTRPEACAAWRADVSDQFVFAIKGSRYITHMLKLRHFEKPLANFFSSASCAWARRWGRSCGSCRRNCLRRCARARLLRRRAARHRGRRTLGAPARLPHHRARGATRARTAAGTDPTRRRGAPSLWLPMPRWRTCARSTSRWWRPTPRAASVLAGTHGRLRLRPPARIDDALRQPLHRRRARGLGRPHRCLDRGRRRRLRLLRQRRAGARAPRRASLASGARS